MGDRKEFIRHSRKVTRTKRWKALRMEILERDGFKCCHCSAKGRLEVDHIQPVRSHPELSYEPRNLQSLCGSCHTRKTRIECGHKPARQDLREWSRAVADLEKPGQPMEHWSIPHGLTASRIPVNIICGPPGAGKTTYAEANATPGDTVIDFDQYLQSVGGSSWDKNPGKVKAAFKLRDAAILSLSSQSRGTAWLTLTAPSDAERQAWARQLVRSKIIMLAVDAETCKARIRADPDRQHATDPMCAGVDRWWRIYAADSGNNPEHQKEIKCLYL
tara:strand:+ start:215 stop:1036 length:822 start_codon:yes stop_codon:yes gene_type:complete